MSNRLRGKRRPGDPWISKNRVLNGGTGKTKRNCPIYRNPNFDTDETKLLIQLWGDPKVQRELITTHKKHLVISQLSAKMEEYGYYRSPEEITTRIKNMKCFYNRLKKEMETNKGIEPSWRHYGEMDAIMTRPIFSVRPNEVPAPSLKYLLEQEQEKRKERKRQAEKEGSTISDSDEDIDDIIAVPTSGSKEKSGNKTNENTAEAECNSEDKSSQISENSAGKRRKTSNEDISQSKNDQTMSEAEMAIKMEIESEEFQEYQSIEPNESKKDANSKKSQETINTIHIIEDDDLLVPKMEPIDVEEEYENNRKQSSPSQNLNQLADILKQPPKAQNIATSSAAPTMIKFTLPSNSSLSTALSSSTATQTQSKISVVSPTILMPPQMATSSSSSDSQRQVRLPSNIHALLASSGSRTTVTNANGMKFLLVNAPDQRGTAITTSNLNSAIPITGTNSPNGVTNTSTVKIIQNSTQLQQQPITQHQQFQQKQQPSQTMPQKSQTSQAGKLAKQEYKDQLKKRDLLGIKTTLLKMLKVQEDANEIENERLAVERERLQFEKSMGDRFLALMEQNQKIQQQMQQQLQQQQLILQQQQQIPIQLQQRSTTSSQVFATNTAQTATVTPNGQIMLPPKLLITTMVPTSAAQGAGTSQTSKVLTSTGFASRTATSTSNSDVQLVVPKEEPPN